MGVYYLPAEDTTSSPQVPGWDSAYKKSTETLAHDDLDLDNLGWGFGNAAGSDFQQAVVTDIAWCSECTSSSHPEGTVSTDGQGWIGAWDVGLGRVWGMNTTPPGRPRGAIDCHLDVLRAPSKVVEYWSDGTDRVIWAGLWNQANGSDRGGVLRSEDDGVTFCYEMTYDRADSLSSRSPNPNWIDPTSRDLLCPEGNASPAWPPCDPGVSLTPGTLWSPDGETGTPLGSTTGIAIARSDLAFALAYDRQADDASLGALVVLEGDITSGISELAGSSGGILVDSDTTGSPSTDCDDLTWDDLFDHTGLFVRISPDSQAPAETSCETSGGCELVVGFHKVDDADSTDAGASCSLFHVTVTESGGTWSSSWASLVLDEDIDDPANTCDVEDSALSDAVIPTWAPDTVFVVGRGHGSSTAGGMCSFDLASDSFVEQVVDADRNMADISSVVAHPHVEDVLYFGSYRDYTQASNSDAPGVFQVSKMVDHVNATEPYRWVTGQISTVDLTHPSFLDLELGLLSGTVEYLFGATGGSGPVEGLFCQEAEEDCE